MNMKRKSTTAVDKKIKPSIIPTTYEYRLYLFGSRRTAHAGDGDLREENTLGPFFENLVDDVQSGATRQIYRLNYFCWWNPCSQNTLPTRGNFNTPPIPLQAQVSSLRTAVRNAQAHVKDPWHWMPMQVVLK